MFVFSVNYYANPFTPHLLLVSLLLWISPTSCKISSTPWLLYLFNYLAISLLYLFIKVLQDLLGIVNISLLCSPHPKTPTGPIFPRHFVHMLLFATREIVSTPAYQIYGAQQFHAFALRLSYSPIYA